ncbi:nucleotidyltransferase family protein [Legionella hackeliae]|uniref:hypothetical protein n=1 Tax=Legionella hackeliae TaxID=449 RepID=UPI003519F627
MSFDYFGSFHFEASGDNPYRARAYRRAARILLKLDKGLVTLLETDFDLTKLPWIRKGIAFTILHILKTNEIPKIKYQSNKLESELKHIHGLGKKRIAVLNDLNIRTKKSLLDAINNQNLRHLKWITLKFEEHLKNEIKHPKSRKFIRLYHAYPIVKILIKNMQEIHEIIQVECMAIFAGKRKFRAN